MTSSPRHLSVALAGTAVMLGVLASWTQASGYRRRAHCYPSIPSYDYQTGRGPERRTLASYPISPVAGQGRKVFQPMSNELIAGDCVVSQIGLILYSDGKYTLSFRARNTAKSTEPAQAVATGPSIKQQAGIETGPVRHHRVNVRARFYSGSTTPNTNVIARADGVQLAEAESGVFLIPAGDERARSIAREAGSTVDLLSRHFGEVTQVEFELEVEPPAPVQARQARGSIWR